MPATSWVTVVVGLLVIVTAAAAVVAFFRMNLSKATIDTLKESNDALRERNQELDARITELSLRQDALERENVILREVIGGKVDFGKITELLQHHHDSVMHDRSQFDQQFTAAMIAVGERLDAQKAMTQDVLNLLGDGRHSTVGSTS